MDHTYGMDRDYKFVSMGETQEEGNVPHMAMVAQGQGSIVIAPQIINSPIQGGVAVNVSPVIQNTAGPSVRSVSTKLKLKMKKRYESIFEAIAKRGAPARLNQIYTEVYITEGEREKEIGHFAATNSGVVNEHEMWQLNSTNCPAINCNDIFKPLCGADVHIRTVLTKGVAGIGKTVSVQKFILDWAEEKANQDVDFIFVLPFRELNRFQNSELSLHELLERFHPEVKNMEDMKYDEAKMIFIFDGLDESYLPLNFRSSLVADIAKRSSLDTLLTNLFIGNLLFSANIWITSRPAAVHRISPDCIYRVTEIQGFNDHQKKEYFKKRFSDEKQAETVISHIRASRSLHTMCHIPMFCWITATVLGSTPSGVVTGDIPYTLTGMYTRFLLIQTNTKNQKYYGKDKRNLRELSPPDVHILLQMGKLAFVNLEKGKLIFSEKDLERYGLNTVETSVHSGLFTEILKKEDPMFDEQLYSFVHLSLQEFLAALYVFQSFVKEKMDVLQLKSSKAHVSHNSCHCIKCWLTDLVQPCQNSGYSPLFDQEYLDDSDFDSEEETLDFQNQQHLEDTPQDFSTLYAWHRVALDKALKSKNGHLDLFLQFFLGLSLETNYKLLKFLSLPPEFCQEDVCKITQHIKQRLEVEDQRKCPTPERCINLLHCLFELGELGDTEGEIKSYLTSKNVPRKKLTAAQCSTLAYITLSSENVLDEFNLNNYRTTAGGRRRLVPLVKCCRKALLINVQLTRKCFETISSVLQSAGSPLRELDLSHNFLIPDTLETLLVGLSSPHCNLDSLNLSYMNLEPAKARVVKAALLGSHTQPICLRLSGCCLRDECSEILLAALQSEKSRLTILDLSYNSLTDAGVTQILTGLTNPNCKLHTLRLGGCVITAESCEVLGSVLERSSLKELDLSVSRVGDEGVKWIFSRTSTQLETLRLRECGLSAGACEVLGKALSSSVLKGLELQDNDLRDSGVKLLCVGLAKPTCILQSLGLSGCLITKKGCIYLASALKSNPSHLRALDLSYNHPGESGERRLSEALEDPNYRLETLDLKHGGLHRTKPMLRKYACELTLDPSTKDPCVQMCLSEDKKTAYVKYPQGRQFQTQLSDAHHLSVTCSEGLTGGRFYWEVQCKKTVMITVKYKGRESMYHKESWCLLCTETSPRYTLNHRNGIFRINRSETELEYEKVGVYLDWPAGRLSFYSGASDRFTHLHTFYNTFTQPLFPVFSLNNIHNTCIRIITL